MNFFGDALSTATCCRRAGGCVVGLAAALLLSQPVSARQPAWASGFASGNLSSSPSCAIVWDDDGAGPHTPSLYLGGNFQTAGGVTVNRIARWSGDNWFSLGTGMTSGTVFALAVFDDDGAGPNAPKLYAAGTFSNAGGVAVQNIARWTGSAWEALPGGGLNSQVSALAVFNGKLYAGGFFTGGCSRYDGATWTSQPVNGTVNAFCVHDDGLGGGAALYLGGTFTSISGVTGAVRIAKWNGTAYSALSTGISGNVNGGSPRVNALASYQGRLIAGGLFNAAGAATGIKSLAQWDGAAWSDFAGGVTLPGTTGVTALYVDPAPAARGTGGGIWCASDATNYGPNNVACNRLGEYDGADWSSPGGGVYNSPPGVIIRFNEVTGGPPEGEGGGLFIGDSNTIVGGVYQPNNAVLVNGAYSTIGGGLTGPSILNQVRAIVPATPDVNDDDATDLLVATDGSVDIGGNFERGASVVGNSLIHYQITCTPREGLPYVKPIPLGIAGSSGPAGPVACLGRRSVNGVRYAGGQFASLVNGTPCNNVLRCNPTSGCAPLGAGLTGGLGNAIYSCLPFGRGQNAFVLFGGDYLGAPGPYGARWGDYSSVMDETPLRADDGPAFAFAVDPSNPDINYVCGNFDNFGGAQGPYCVRVNTQTGQCESMGVTNPQGGYYVNGPIGNACVPAPPIQQATGYAIIVLGDMSLPQRGIAARDAGGTWVAPVPNDALDNGTTCGTIFDDGTPGTWLYMGGFFTRSPTTNATLNRICRVNLALPPADRRFEPVQLNGTVPGCNAAVRAMAEAYLSIISTPSAGSGERAGPSQRIGALLIGGDFTTAGGMSSSRIAAILGTRVYAPACPTDLNHDGVTNTADLVKLLLQFGRCPGDQGYVPRTNLDGSSSCINTGDLVQLLLKFGQACPS